MNRIKHFLRPTEPLMTRFEDIHRMDWAEPEKRSVWPVVWSYVQAGLCWMLVVAGTLAAVWLGGFVGAMGARCGWGY